MILHCFFEQSGTFKNEAKKLGLRAYDYDIKNDFQQTDFKTDLFDAINQGYVGQKSVFDLIGKEDYVIAFFPCVRFEKLAYWYQSPNIERSFSTMDGWSGQYLVR